MTTDVMHFVGLCGLILGLGSFIIAVVAYLSLRDHVKEVSERFGFHADMLRVATIGLDDRLKSIEDAWADQSWVDEVDDRLEVLSDRLAALESRPELKASELNVAASKFGDVLRPSPPINNGSVVSRPADVAETAWGKVPIDNPNIVEVTPGEIEQESAYRNAFRDREIFTALRSCGISLIKCSTMLENWRPDFYVQDNGVEMRVLSRHLDQPVLSVVRDRLSRGFLDPVGNPNNVGVDPVSRSPITCDDLRHFGHR